VVVGYDSVMPDAPEPLDYATPSRRNRGDGGGSGQRPSRGRSPFALAALAWFLFGVSIVEFHVGIVSGILGTRGEVLLLRMAIVSCVIGLVVALTGIRAHPLLLTMCSCIANGLTLSYIASCYRLIP
jgi:hypothetical protein